MIHSIRVKPLALMEEPASFYSSDDVEITWDCIITTDARAEGEGNRPDLVMTDKKKKVVNIVEMACPSWRNREESDRRKTEKYKTVRQEMTERHTGFRIVQTNIIGDILGRFNKDLKALINELHNSCQTRVGQRAENHLVACCKNCRTCGFLKEKKQTFIILGLDLLLDSWYL